MVFQELRNKLLQKAITGQLVPQLDSEPMVEQLGPAPKPEEVPFAIPDKWKWVYLGGFINIISGTSYTSTDVAVESNSCDRIRVIRGGNVGENGEIFFLEDDVYVQNTLSDSNKQIKEGDVVIVASTGSANAIGRPSFALTDLDCQIGAFLRIIRLKTDQQLIPEFLHIFFRSSLYRKAIQTLASGSVIRNIKKQHLAGLLLPLPPVTEQQRIVVKLKPLLEELDAMERAYTELSGPMYAHFKDLILQKAISGKLVPQLDSEPAVEQLGPAPKAEEVPFAIPEKWKWVALEDLFQFVDYRGKTPIKSASGVRLITSSNVRRGYLDHTRCEYISIDEYQSRQSRGVSHKGDILFTTEAPLGNVALADLDVFSVGQRVITLKSKGLALNECFVWFLLSNYFQTEILKQATGSTVQGIKAARLKKLVLPLPPIEEQKRIAARINKLFAEADKLLALKELSL